MASGISLFMLPIMGNPVLLAPDKRFDRWMERFPSPAPLPGLLQSQQARGGGNMIPNWSLACLSHLCGRVVLLRLPSSGVPPGDLTPIPLGVFTGRSIFQPNCFWTVEDVHRKPWEGIWRKKQNNRHPHSLPKAWHKRKQEQEGRGSNKTPVPKHRGLKPARHSCVLARKKGGERGNCKFPGRNHLGHPLLGRGVSSEPAKIFAFSAFFIQTSFFGTESGLACRTAQRFDLLR